MGGTTPNDNEEDTVGVWEGVGPRDVVLDAVNDALPVQEEELDEVDVTWDDAVPDKVLEAVAAAVRDADAPNECVTDTVDDSDIGGVGGTLLDGLRDTRVGVEVAVELGVCEPDALPVEEEVAVGDADAVTDGEGDTDALHDEDKELLGVPELDAVLVSVRDAVSDGVPLADMEGDDVAADAAGVPEEEAAGDPDTDEVGVASGVPETDGVTEDDGVVDGELVYDADGEAPNDSDPDDDGVEVAVCDNGAGVSDPVRVTVADTLPVPL